MPASKRKVVDLTIDTPAPNTNPVSTAAQAPKKKRTTDTEPKAKPNRELWPEIIEYLTQLKECCHDLDKPDQSLFNQYCGTAGRFAFGRQQDDDPLARKHCSRELSLTHSITSRPHGKPMYKLLQQIGSVMDREIDDDIDNGVIPSDDPAAKEMQKNLFGLHLKTDKMKKAHKARRGKSGGGKNTDQAAAGTEVAKGDATKEDKTGRTNGRDGTDRWVKQPKGRRGGRGDFGGK